MKIGLKYKNEEHIFDECISAGVPFLKYPILEKEGLVEHGISTRLGGVSEGFLGSMNLIPEGMIPRMWTRITEEWQLQSA